MEQLLGLAFDAFLRTVTTCGAIDAKRTRAGVTSAWARPPLTPLPVKGPSAVGVGEGVWRGGLSENSGSGETWTTEMAR